MFDWTHLQVHEYPERYCKAAAIELIVNCWRYGIHLDGLVTAALYENTLIITFGAVAGFPPEYADLLAWGMFRSGIPGIAESKLIWKGGAFFRLDKHQQSPVFYGTSRRYESVTVQVTAVARAELQRLIAFYRSLREQE